MFERFTDKARRVIVLAQDEARELEHSLIRPEHILLGLIRAEGVASTALSQEGVEYGPVRQQVVANLASALGAGRMTKVPFSPKAKKVLELSLREALRLGHNYIGTEHILLGLLRNADADAAGDGVNVILAGVAGQLRARVIELVSNASSGVPTRSPAVEEATSRARHLAGEAPITTGDLLTAILGDPQSQAATALTSLGVTPEKLSGALAKVAIGSTTDSLPGPVVEIRVGDLTTTVQDLDLAAALKGLSPDEILAALQRAFGTGPGRKATGS
jgi:ATP-dependent Clp protease ATP-binding subunit ClpA